MCFDLFIHGDERGQCCFWKGVKVIGRGARGHILGVLWRGCVAVHVSPLGCCVRQLSLVIQILILLFSCGGGDFYPRGPVLRCRSFPVLLSTQWRDMPVWYSWSPRLGWSLVSVAGQLVACLWLSSGYVLWHLGIALQGFGVGRLCLCVGKVPQCNFLFKEVLLLSELPFIFLFVKVCQLLLVQRLFPQLLLRCSVLLPHLCQCTVRV